MWNLTLLRSPTRRTAQSPFNDGCPLLRQDLAEGSGDLSGRPCNPRSDFRLGEFSHRHHAHAGLEARNSGHGYSDPVGTLLSVARGDDPGRVQCTSGRSASSQNGSPPGARLKGVARSHAIRDVDIGTGWLDHNRGKRFSAIDDGEMSGRSDGVGKQSQSGEGDIANNRLHLAPECQDGEAQSAAAIDGSPDEGVLLKGDD